jgi:hypothetical protein
MTTSLSTLHEGNSAMYTRTLPALLFTPFRIGPEEDVFVNLLWPRKPLCTSTTLSPCRPTLVHVTLHRPLNMGPLNNL